MAGLLGKKIGMTQVFDKSGFVVPVTVIEAGPCIVTKKIAEDNSIQLGFRNAKKINKPAFGHLKKSGIETALKYLKQFKVSDMDSYSEAQEIKADFFKIGDKVLVTGTSIGKGFAGTVKRYHFRRSPMSHGSKSHRIPGSIGAGTTPGRVVRGKKMSGRMGGEKVTVKNLEIVDINLEKNILFLKGAVPGPSNSFLVIRKAGSK